MDFVGKYSRDKKFLQPVKNYIKIPLLLMASTCAAQKLDANLAFPKKQIALKSSSNYSIETNRFKTLGVLKLRH